MQNRLTLIQWRAFIAQHYGKLTIVQKHFWCLVHYGNFGWASNMNWKGNIFVVGDNVQRQKKLKGDKMIAIHKFKSYAIRTWTIWRANISAHDFKVKLWVLHCKKSVIMNNNKSMIDQIFSDNDVCWFFNGFCPFMAMNKRNETRENNYLETIFKGKRFIKRELCINKRI